MTQLVWGQPGTRVYESGVDRGVVYPNLGVGVAWSGIVSVDESPSGGEVEPYYFNGVKYIDLVLGEDFKATVEAFSAPPEFAVCEGTKPLAPGLFVTQQPRVLFGFSYRTHIGNDVEGPNAGYKLHLVYNATAEPSSKTNRTQSQSVDPGTRQWNMSTVPVRSSMNKPTAHMIIDSTLTAPEKLSVIEGMLYGTASTQPYLPSQVNVIQALS